MNKLRQPNKSHPGLAGRKRNPYTRKMLPLRPANLAEWQELRRLLPKDSRKAFTLIFLALQYYMPIHEEKTKINPSS